jgi:hypothetical protein
MTELEQFRRFLVNSLGTTYGASDETLAVYARVAKTDVENSGTPWSWRAIAAERLRGDREAAA